jgi:hypothetical protein
MFTVLDKVVYGMAGLRFISSLIELSGAFLMLYFGSAAKALQINAGLAFIGPLVLVTVTILGVSGMADSISWVRAMWIVLGVLCILFGTRN